MGVAIHYRQDKKGEWYHLGPSQFKLKFPRTDLLLPSAKYRLPSFSPCFPTYLDVSSRVGEVYADSHLLIGFGSVCVDGEQTCCRV